MPSLSEPDRIDTIGDGYRWDGPSYKIGSGGRATHIPKTPFPVFGACAGAALYRRRMLDEIGLFDERYFAYMEDVDLAIRARLAGWTCICVPRAVVLHAGVKAIAPRLLAVIRQAVGAPASDTERSYAEHRTGASEQAGDRLATETRA